MFAHSQEVPFYLSSKFHYNLSTQSVLARMPVNLRPDGTPVVLKEYQSEGVT